MTDARDLTPEQDAVRRLLADARHDGSMPPGVVARLEEALAALVADRGDVPLVPDPGHHPPAPAVALGARRRRRVGIGVLAAAAAVVAGVTIGQGIPGMSGSDDSGSTADGDTSASQAREFGTPDDLSGGSDENGAAGMGPESLKSPAPVPAAGYPTLSSSAADLDDELLDLRPTASTEPAESGAADRLVTCDLWGIGPGRRLLAQVDGQAGLVIFRRPHGPAQRVDLYVCGNPDPVRTRTLPAR